MIFQPYFPKITYLCIELNLLRMQKINFRECTLSLLEDTFGLEQIDNHPKMTDWLALPYQTSEQEQQQLLKMQRKMLKNIIHWNEYELVSNFIVPMFMEVDFTTKKFNDFGERNIQAEIGGYLLSGNPDGIIATGFREPKIPYFAFQEYKPQTDPYGEPAGQCLGAMLVGQALNKNTQIIYGCHVIGTAWRFMVLEGKNFCISKSYVVDDEEIIEVYRILQGLKTTLLEIIP